ncbi:hypothetical protein niasHT_005498 [Heterodera trifolii]|uniref:Uncharacterized protein n=1 Tax=Heterodera trifolii TaxID=157864 RepID=A0ABD2LSS6_9BILA
MEIVNGKWKRLPIPQIQMPRKVIGFERIIINFIDRNVIAFLHYFCPLFTSFCPINLDIDTESDGIAELVMHNIWPLITKNIRWMFLPANVFHHLRKFAPSFLNDCPSLHVVSLYFDDLFAEFPADDNAMASDGQSVAKWLFTPLQNNVPKMLECSLINTDGNLASTIEPFKAAFASASSPVNFIVVIWSYFAFSVVPFDLINGFTHEQLTLKRVSEMGRFMLIRCPIVRDESKWTKWEKEAIDWKFYDQWNRIEIDERCEIGKGLLNATPGRSDQQQK